MPRASQLGQAQADDDDLAIALAARQADDQADILRPTGPRVSAWSEEVELLTDLADIAKRTLDVLTAQATGQKQIPAHVPAPRPRTASHRLEETRRRRARAALAESISDAQRRWAKKHAQAPTSTD